MALSAQAACSTLPSVSNSPKGLRRPTPPTLPLNRDAAAGGSIPLMLHRPRPSARGMQLEPLELDKSTSSQAYPIGLGSPTSARHFIEVTSTDPSCLTSRLLGQGTVRMRPPPQLAPLSVPQPQMARLSSLPSVPAALSSCSLLHQHPFPASQAPVGPARTTLQPSHTVAQPAALHSCARSTSVSQRHTAEECSYDDEPNALAIIRTPSSTSSASSPRNAIPNAGQGTKAQTSGIADFFDAKVPQSQAHESASTSTNSPQHNLLTVSVGANGEFLGLCIQEADPWRGGDSPLLGPHEAATRIQVAYRERLARQTQKQTESSRSSDETEVRQFLLAYK